MHNVAMVYVPACLNITATRIQDVAQNAFKASIALKRKHVFEINVLTLVQEHVDKMHNVM